MNEMRSVASGMSAPGWVAEGAGEDESSIVRRSGLFDEAHYRKAYFGVGASSLDPLAHFMSHGWREGRCPSAYFDVAYYLRQNPDVAQRGVNPLLDYIQGGEAKGRAPAAWFDLFWYRTRHAIDPGQTALRHFLERRFDGTVNPVPEFDAAYYLETYSDIAQAGADPFEHFLNWGYTEGRNPSAAFDTRFYIERHLGGDLTINPLMHYRMVRQVAPLPTAPPASERAVFTEMRRFTQPGPLFERLRPLPRGATRHAKVLANYLPQFHAIPENDTWWGKGFTEWRTVGRGLPRFIDHYQPRSPGDLGHYSLDDPATLRRQAEMARDAGVFGFVMYFYWFNCRRLLERPVEAFLADPSIDFPFCLMWANENWTRRWDGSDDDVLISQDYRAADDTALVDCYARHFRDPRYIRADGRPVLMIYRPRLIPDTRATVARWRALFAERHGVAPLLVMAQSFGDADPRPYGMDGAIEFPPHKLVDGLAQRNMALTQLDPHARGQVFAYDDVAAASLAAPMPPYPLIKTAVPSWDNDARRQGQGLVLHGSTPAAYEAWMTKLVANARAHPFFGERFVCVNAWNEWAEGAYLEPDLHFGGAYANATARAVARMPPVARAGRILLVGHDAFPAGAQHLLLSLGAMLRRRFGVQAEFLLLAGGAMLDAYEQVAPTRVAASRAAVVAALAEFAARGYATAIVNTAAAAWVGPLAAEAGCAVTLLVHELARVLHERALVEGAAACVAVAERVVFPEAGVAATFRAHVAVADAAVRIMPQGCYRPVTRDLAARARRRAAAGLADATRLVLGVGTGDHRKGFDIFVQAWHAARHVEPGVVFCWLGAIDPQVRTWMGGEIDAAVATGTFLAPGFTSDVEEWLSAADAFALTSREDPFPTVLLEALSAGLPVAAFAGSGGAPGLIDALGGGACVAMGDATAMAMALLGFDLAADRSALAARVAAEFRFDAYAARLLAEVRGDLPTISVAIPSCDYARYLAGRLGTVFAQTLPVAEVMLLDDASRDDSAAVAREAAADWRRDLDVVVRPTRSGSPFGQWRAAAERARGEWLWIAEADDESDPTFLERAAEAIRAAGDLVLVACDSRSIDGAGAPLWPSYQVYFTESGAGELARAQVMPARDFAARYLAERNLLLNVSSVLWRRSALLAALDRCEAELPDWRLAGDWRVYLELLADSSGQVAWIAEPLNVHRRHEAGVTATVDARAHLREIARMHDLLRDRLGLDASAVARQAAYRAEVARQFRKTRTAPEPARDAAELV